MALKVFQKTGFASGEWWETNFGRRSTHLQVRCLVAAPSKKAAAAALGCSLYEFNNYAWDGGGTDVERAIAIASPGTVFAQPLDTYGDEREKWAPLD